VSKAKFAVRKALHKAGVLHAVRKLKGSGERPLFNPADPRTQMSTLTCLDWLSSRGLLEGTDVLEFGIFRGFNVWFSQAYCRLRGVRDVRFFGFDSFFGLPEISGVDSRGTFHEGEFSAYKADVEHYFTRFSVDWTQTFLVEGFFSETLNPATIQRLSVRPCSLAVVDCDLYSSTVEVLNFLEGLLCPVSVIYFDDWRDFGNVDAGEPLAFREFQERTAARFRTEDIPLTPGITKGKAFALYRLP